MENILTAQPISNPPYEPWQLQQLQKLSVTEPERLQPIFEAIWAAFPDLYEELLISAVDQEVLASVDAADRLGISPTSIDLMVIDARHKRLALGHSIVQSGNQPAKLAESQVAVWEVVREYRKHRSVEKLKESYPSLNVSEIQAALLYWEGNVEVVENQIQRYEDRIGKRSQVLDLQ